MSIILWLVLGFVLGWILAGPAARKIVLRHAVPAYIGIGAIGAIVGFLIIRALGFPRGSLTYAAAAAIAVAIVLAIVARATGKV